jgi:hypothetical protein
MKGTVGGAPRPGTPLLISAPAVTVPCPAASRRAVRWHALLGQQCRRPERSRNGVDRAADENGRSREGPRDPGLRN